MKITFDTVSARFTISGIAADTDTMAAMAAVVTMFTAPRAVLMAKPAKPVDKTPFGNKIDKGMGFGS